MIGGGAARAKRADCRLRVASHPRRALPAARPPRRHAAREPRDEGVQAGECGGVAAPGCSARGSERPWDEPAAQSVPVAGPPARVGDGGEPAAQQRTGALNGALEDGSIRAAGVGLQRVLQQGGGPRRVGARTARVHNDCLDECTEADDQYDGRMLPRHRRPCPRARRGLNSSSERVEPVAPIECAGLRGSAHGLNARARGHLHQDFGREPLLQPQGVCGAAGEEGTSLFR